MAWYDISHSCGHASEQQIYGTNVRGERERKAERLGKDPCPACKRGAYNERNKQAAARAEQEQWPDLTGTRKQVAWAQTLRVEFLAKAAAEVRAEYGDNEPLLALTAEILLRETEASWWIDQRIQRRWLGFLGRARVYPEWIETAAPKGQPNIFDQIEADMADIEHKSDVDTVLGAERALWQGRITAAQWQQVWAWCNQVKEEGKSWWPPGSNSSQPS